jgi:hypothetical protein
MDKPWKSSLGIWIYPTLPPGMRIAVREDFLDQNQQLITGKDFLVKSFHFDRFEAHKTSDNFFQKWKLWLDENHLYVKNDC